tara:strand:- start:256 stop:450 length:195 start_codon:yes stop_codon:yes gene_type:complete
VYKPTDELCWKDGLKLDHIISKEEVTERADTIMMQSQSYTQKRLSKRRWKWNNERKTKTYVEAL